MVKTHRVGSVITPVHLPVVVDLRVRRQHQLARDVGLGEADLPPGAQARALEVQLAVLGRRGAGGDGVGLELGELVRLGDPAAGAGHRVGPLRAPVARVLELRHGADGGGQLAGAQDARVEGGGQGGEGEEGGCEEFGQHSPGWCYLQRGSGSIISKRIIVVGRKQ